MEGVLPLLKNVVARSSSNSRTHLLPPSLLSDLWTARTRAAHERISLIGSTRADRKHSASIGGLVVDARTMEFQHNSPVNGFHESGLSLDFHTAKHEHVCVHLVSVTKLI